MMELLFGLLFVAYLVGVAFYINKTIEDYNDSLETKGSKISESSKSLEIYAPCIDC